MLFCGIIIPQVPTTPNSCYKSINRIKFKLDFKRATNNSEKSCKIRIYALNSHKYDNLKT